jgi:hypothetical protein
MSETSRTVEGLGTQRTQSRFHTFEAARATGRTPYFLFEGPPKAGVEAALQRYGQRYGIRPKIDTVPLGG